MTNGFIVNEYLIVKKGADWMCSREKIFTEFLGKGLLWCCGAVVIIAAQLLSTKTDTRFCAYPISACGVPEVYDGENL